MQCFIFTRSGAQMDYSMTCITNKGEEALKEKLLLEQKNLLIHKNR